MEIPPLNIESGHDNLAFAFCRDPDWWKDERIEPVADSSPYQYKFYSTKTETCRSLESEFNERADRWQKETAAFSSPEGMYLHRDYIAIIAKGMENPKEIVPLILNRLRLRGGDWFFALETIAGENPAHDMEDYEAALIAWQKWVDQLD